MFRVFDKYITEGGKAFELHRESYNSRGDARAEGEKLKGRGRIQAYRTREKTYEGAFGKDRKKYALYVR